MTTEKKREALRIRAAESIPFLERLLSDDESIKVCSDEQYTEIMEAVKARLAELPDDDIEQIYAAWM